MSKRVIRIVITVTILAALIVGYYIYLNKRPIKGVEDTIDKSKVGQILSVDMELNYPTNPHDVVAYYSRVIKAYYDLEYNDEQLVELAKHARATFDDELIGLNDFDEYFERLQLEIESYKLAKKKIIDYVIERSLDNELFIDNGQEYARVKAVYYTRENNSERKKVYEQYTLRKDGNGNWKIVFWEVIPECIIKGD